MNRQEVMDLLGVKEYWMTEDEQQLIDEYRKAQWGSDKNDENTEKYNKN